MDFSDFSEFIGPLIFALIAWLSNYFGKKKKQDEKQPVISDNKQKNNDESSIEKLFQSTFRENISKIFIICFCILRFFDRIMFFLGFECLLGDPILPFDMT